MLFPAGCKRPETSGAEAGIAQSAPSFELDKLGGGKIRLEDFKGKVVLLDFWATYCIPCHKSIPVFQRMYEDFGTKNFSIIGISVDAYTEHVPEFVKEFSMGYPVALDPARATPKAYGVHNLPTTFLIDREGRIQREWRGFDPMIGEEIRAVVASELHNKKTFQ